ncbi:hypothetical protein MAR_035362, partial [Mya arenaria]
SGPTNIRIEERLSNGVRLTWDIPEKSSCYGRVGIELVVYLGNGQTRDIQVNSEQTSVDIVGLDPDKEYTVSLNVGYEGTELASLLYTFNTAEEENHLKGYIIAGIVVGVLVLIGLLVAICLIMLRRGHTQKVQREQRTVSVRYGKTTADRDFSSENSRAFADPVYVCAEMDIVSFQLARDSVTFQPLLGSGSFADIYPATIANSDTKAVAKVLKSK